MSDIEEITTDYSSVKEVKENMKKELVAKIGFRPFSEVDWFADELRLNLCPANPVLNESLDCCF